MISNDQELDVVSQQLQQLKLQRDSILRKTSDTPFRLHVEVAGIEKMIARLQEEIDAYELGKTAACEALSRSTT